MALEEIHADTALGNVDVPTSDTTSTARTTWTALWPYLVLGTIFGTALTKSEVVSWFRIQEMFRFQSIHMYGVIASAIIVAGLSIRVIEKLQLTDLRGQPIVVPPKQMGSGLRYVIGGTIFGLGWGLTGACPAPILALIGSGVAPALVVLVAALVGTWTYAAVRRWLPH